MDSARPYPQAYGAKNKNNDIRYKSQSGGVFSAISDQILKKNGRVYGCLLTEDFLAEHRGINTTSDRNSFRGSKYIQSDKKRTFKEVARDLNSENIVLYTGTPCEIGALKSYLKHARVPTENLFLIDLLCFGVASPAIWKSYLKYFSEQKNGTIEKALFRDKKYGWNSHINTIRINGQNYGSNVFPLLYGSQLISRESCLYCPYKTYNRHGDITMGDFWGIENHFEEFIDDIGVSIVMVNSDKGRKLFDLASSALTLIEAPKGTYHQFVLSGSQGAPALREKFWKDYRKFEFSKLLKFYTSRKFLSRVKRKLYAYYYKFFKQRNNKNLIKCNSANSLKDETPNLVPTEQSCCGCTACFAICPTDAITMTKNEKGFLYPSIDKNKCIKCYKCVDVCTFKKDQCKLN